MSPKNNAPSRYWAVRKPSANGAVVARFDTAGESAVPEAVAAHDAFEIQSLPGQAALENTTIDRSGLTDAERQILPDGG